MPVACCSSPDRPIRPPVARSHQRRLSMTRHAAIFLMVCSAQLVSAGASAQSVGIGPRFSFVRGELTPNAPPTRFVGGTLRMVASRHTVFEAAMDYRAFYNEAATQR